MVWVGLWFSLWPAWFGLSPGGCPVGVQFWPVWVQLESSWGPGWSSYVPVGSSWDYWVCLDFSLEITRLLAELPRFQAGWWGWQW